MEIVDEEREFFAPVSFDLVDGLISQYKAMRAKLEHISAMINSEMAEAMQYFFDGNSDPDRGTGRYTVGQVFHLDGAIAELNGCYWTKALALTDVLDFMPQARRTEWNDSIKNHKTPEFTEETVRSTLSQLIAMRTQFFAERIDGIFRGLSGEHVTNAPEAFGKRMIINHILSYGSIRHEKAGLINDLRCVVAKFMGRDDLKYNASESVLSEARRNHGQWLVMDAGAIRLRVYKKGTAHLEVHPEMAWRLNQVLSHLYPMAIPAQFRQKPKKQVKEFKMMGRPLPFAVLELLAVNYNIRYRRPHGDTSFRFDYSADKNSPAYQEAGRVLVSIGGVMNKDGGFDFDYEYPEVITKIVMTGCVPDQKTHQFYPTPESVGKIAVEMAQIGEADTVLEPSAGQGDLAALLPKDRTTCVEISALHAAILKARGFTTVQADFLQWADMQSPAQPFDRVVMNPPFSEGRAQLHVQVAAALVKFGGRLVAIMPASYKGKNVLPGWDCEWSDVFTGEFAGASVSVVIMTGVRP